MVAIRSNDRSQTTTVRPQKGKLWDLACHWLYRCTVSIVRDTYPRTQLRKPGKVHLQENVKFGSHFQITNPLWIMFPVSYYVMPYDIIIIFAIWHILLLCTDYVNSRSLVRVRSSRRFWKIGPETLHTYSYMFYESQQTRYPSVFLKKNPSDTCFCFSSWVFWPWETPKCPTKKQKLKNTVLVKASVGAKIKSVQKFRSYLY